MGLPRAAIHLLLHESARTQWNGCIATLGRQHVYATYDEIKAMSQAHRISQLRGEPMLHRDPDLRKAGYLSDDCLYELLGFDRSVRVDWSDYEGAEEMLDLNAPVTPGHLCDAFDVVLDSGTVEHVFEIGRALRHCLRMAKPGGRIIHLTPSSNAINHGFYSVSPTLFADFYRSNGCEVEKLWLCRLRGNFVRNRWDVYDCLSSDRNWLPLGRLDGSLWLTYAVIRKAVHVESKTPQQAFYVDTWSDCEPTSIDTQSGQHTHSQLAARAGKVGKAGRLLAATEKWGPLHLAANFGIDLWRNWASARAESRKGRVPFRYVGRY